MERKLGLYAVAFSLSVAALVAFAQTEAVSGRWTTALERGQQSMTVKMDLKVSGNSVTGTIDVAPDVTVQIQNGKLEGGQLTFDVTAPEHGHTKSIHFTGDVRDDTITLKNESRGKQGRTMTFHRTGSKTRGGLALSLCPIHSHAAACLERSPLGEISRRVRTRLEPS